MALVSIVIKIHDDGLNISHPIYLCCLCNSVNFNNVEPRCRFTFRINHRFIVGLDSAFCLFFLCFILCCFRPCRIYSRTDRSRKRDCQHYRCDLLCNILHISFSSMVTDFRYIMSYILAVFRPADPDTKQTIPYYSYHKKYEYL